MQNYNGQTYTTLTILDYETFIVVGEDALRLPCPKCGGAGDHWSKLYESVCLRCHGGGLRPGGKTYTVESATKSVAAKIKRADKAAKEAAVVAEAARIKEEERAAAKAARDAEKAAVSEYLGEAGDKVEFTGEVVYTKSIDGAYGSSMLIIIKVSETVTVKTFATAAWVWEAKKGDTISLKATIKANEEYNGIKSSLITRSKVVA